MAIILNWLHNRKISDSLKRINGKSLLSGGSFKKQLRAAAALGLRFICKENRKLAIGNRKIEKWYVSLFLRRI
jgi:hypothetical protein